MNIWDVLILLVVAAAVFLAVRAIRKGKAGGCHNCPDCAGNCKTCAQHGEKRNESGAQ